MYFNKFKNKLHQHIYRRSLYYMVYQKHFYSGRHKDIRPYQNRNIHFQHVRALCKRNNEIFLCMQIKSCPANFRVKQFKCILPYDIISFVPVPVFSLTNFLFFCKGDIAFYSLVSKAVYLSRTILVIQALSNWDQNNFYFEKQDTSITVNSKSNLFRNFYLPL